MSGEAAPDRTGGGWRREVRAFGELLALSGLAITQPLLDVFGRAPEHLVFRGVGAGEIVRFALLVTLAVPVFAWLVEALVGLVSDRARTVVHRLALGVLTAVLVTPVVDLIAPRPVALFAGALIAGAFVVLYVRTRGPRIWLSFLGPAPIVFLALFLFASPVAPLLRDGPGALPTEVGRPTRTVIVVFDELPLPMLLDADGDIDTDLFPNFGRLADRSTWYREATTTVSITGTALPMMLTGDLPESGSTPDSTSHPENLFTLVGGSMPVTASEAITRLCPVSVCERVVRESDGLGDLLDDARSVLAERLAYPEPETDPLSTMVEEDLSPAEPDPDAEVDAFTPAEDGGIGRFDRFLDAIDDDAGLHLLHLLLPHTPYRFLPDGTTYPGEGAMIGRGVEGWVDDPTPVSVGVRRHLLQLMWTDSLLGRVLDHLETNDLLDDTNLIVTADHGFGYEPGGPVRGFDTEDLTVDAAIAEIVWVPLFVHEAGRENGRISDEPVRTIDLTPTVADLLDVEIPWPHTGRSVLDGGSGSDDEVGLHLGTSKSTGAEPPLDRTLDRQLGRRLLLERTAGVLAPPGDGVTGADRIHRAGPRPDLWAEPVPADAVPLTVVIDGASRADDVDPESGEVPALFAATTDTEHVGEVVAVAVDGTVWATTVVWGHDGDARIDAILPARAFRSGGNDLTVHLVPEHPP